MANDKREQAFEQVKKTSNLLGVWDKNACMYDHEKMWLDGYDAGHAAATAEGIPQADGWVDVAVRLPDGDFTEYLICLENKSVFRATYLGKKEWLVAGVGSVKDHNPVIAWQPLPAPYQRQSSEGE